MSIENLKTVKCDTFIFIICSKCKNEVEKSLKEEESTEIYKNSWFD